MKPVTAEFKSELLQCLPKARRFALTLVRDPSDADDLVQSALESVNQWLEVREGNKHGCLAEYDYS